jgi:putative transposase
MGYSTGRHTTFHHRYHIVWAPKCRYKVLHGEVRLRVREIIRQVCDELGVKIINGALSRDYVHMFSVISTTFAVSIPFRLGRKIRLSSRKALSSHSELAF